MNYIDTISDKKKKIQAIIIYYNKTISFIFSVVIILQGLRRIAEEAESRTRCLVQRQGEHVLRGKISALIIFISYYSLTLSFWKGYISCTSRGTMRKLPPLPHGNGNWRENELHSKVN